MNLRILFIYTCICYTAIAQDVNYRSLSDHKHLVSAYFGADYSSYYGASYGYVLKTKYTPVIIGTEFTPSFGKDKFDDWRWRSSLQAELWKNDYLSLAFKPCFVVRRYASPLARMYSVGTDMTVTFGYIRPKWGLVGLFNYDKSLATHIKHGTLRESYPGISDGWFGASGGNFKLGARLHYSYKSLNTFLTLGKHYGQNFKDNPTLPFFAEVSVQWQFR